MKTVKQPNEQAIRQMMDTLGSGVVKLPHYSRGKTIDFIYEIPLGLILQLALKSWLCFRQGTGIRHLRNGAYQCNFCKSSVKPTFTYCPQCARRLITKDKPDIDDEAFWKDITNTVTREDDEDEPIVESEE
jgi:hypothetical protein